MSTWWRITCKKCGHEETYHTPRTTGGAAEERDWAESHAKEPCPKCGAKDRELST